MKDMKSEIQKRQLCALRDKEFLELYHPTLDALMRQGMSASRARRAAVEFTIANGHPHYHVDHERAYRCVCHLLNAEQKKASNARTYRTSHEMGLAKRRLRQQMWFEIARQVAALRARGMSVADAIDHVLEHCRASRFFISPTTALTKICPAARTRALR
jgi:LmbE family N-acetylglucosaminyl deacetylase